MISLLLTLALIGLLVWAIITFIPMPEPWRKGIIGVAGVLTLLWLLGQLGFGDIPVPRLR